MSRLLAVALTAASVAWVALLIAAPLVLARAPGSPSIAVLYTAAGLVCHQRPERSFAIAGTQLPVCARCLGLYAAGAAGAVAALAVGARRLRGGSRAVRVALALAAAPTIVTVVVEWVALAVPSNAVRAVAALPLGAAAGWIFVQLLLDENHGANARPRAARV